MLRSNDFVVTKNARTLPTMKDATPLMCHLKGKIATAEPLFATDPCLK